MKILIIGGTGIISSEICSLAIKRGHDVTIVNRGNRKAFIHEKAHLILADIRKESVEELRKKLEQNVYDVVIDFISYNVSHIKKMLKVINGKCMQYIFISSATVYKDKVSGLYIEDDEIGNDKWQYCMEKSECEWYLENNKETLGCKYTIIRPYVTYGKTRFPCQIAPIEYYTIINRIINGKPILICGRDTKCTVTNSKEFAIAAVGLFLNPKAYGEAFHITASRDTTWGNVIETIGRKLDCKVDFVDIPIDYLLHKKNIGIDMAELVGDKSRNMVFDNSKIRQAVPEFKGEISFDTGIDDTIKYYRENVKARKINYIWDARVDRIILDYLKDNRIAYKKESLKQVSSEYYGMKERVLYQVGKSDFIYTLTKKLKNVLKK